MALPVQELPAGLRAGLGADSGVEPGTAGLAGMPVPGPLTAASRGLEEADPGLDADDLALECQDLVSLPGDHLLRKRIRYGTESARQAQTARYCGMPGPVIVDLVETSGSLVETRSQ